MRYFQVLQTFSTEQRQCATLVDSVVIMDYKLLREAIKLVSLGSKNVSCLPLTGFETVTKFRGGHDEDGQHRFTHRNALLSSVRSMSAKKEAVSVSRRGALQQRICVVENPCLISSEPRIFKTVSQGSKHK
jgi:hypothetical protein